MGIRSRSDVIAAKIKLYSELLYCDELTDSEVKLMAQLETDPDVEKRLREVRARQMEKP
jgi:hypothetical protein